MYALLKLNWLLLLLVPLNIIAGTYLVSWLGPERVSELIPLLLVSTFEIGFVRECLVRNNYPTVKILKKSIGLSFLIFAALFAIILFFFSYQIRFNVVAIFFLSLLLNELKAYYDGFKRYDLGYLFRILS